MGRDSKNHTPKLDIEPDFLDIKIPLKQILVIYLVYLRGIISLLPSSPFPLSFYSVGICIIVRNSRFYSRGRVWAVPTKRHSIQCFICHAKNPKKMNNIFSPGYTVSRKTYSTTRLYISISYQKDLLSKDTRIFTASKNLALEY